MLFKRKPTSSFIIWPCYRFICIWWSTENRDKLWPHIYIGFVPGISAGTTPYIPNHQTLCLPRFPHLLYLLRNQESLTQRALVCNEDTVEDLGVRTRAQSWRQHQTTTSISENHEPDWAPKCCSLILIGSTAKLKAGWNTKNLILTFSVPWTCFRILD